MKILTKYIYLRFILTFVVIQSILSFIYLLIDLIGKIDSFLSKQISVKILAMYMVSKIPVAISQLTPVAVLICSVIVVIGMAKRNEILVIISSGISTWSIKFQIVIISAIIAVLSFVTGEFLGTKSLDAAQDIIKYYVRREEAKLGAVRDNVWHKAGNVIFYCDRFKEASLSVERPIIIFLDGEFRLVKQVNGNRGYYKERAWVIEAGYEQRLAADGSFRTEAFDMEVVEVPITPKDLSQSAPDPLLMNFFELKRFIEKVSRAGYDTTMYVVNLYTRILFPFIHVVMAFIGSVLALVMKERPLPVVVSASIVFCFFYLLTFGIFRSAALSGSIHPVFSLSMPNVLFLVLGYIVDQLEV